MQDCWIVGAVRTPVGRYGGALSSVRPDDLAAVAIRGLLERTGVPGEDVEDVIFGAANQAGEDNRNVARMALLLADLPVTVGGVTVNRLCGSGLEAVNQANRAIRLGEGDVMIAGGVESMSRAPLVMAKPERAFPRGNATVYDTTIGWRFVNAELAKRYPPESMGETAENVAERYGVSREDQDRFALRSQQRAAAAIREGKFKEEIVPVPVTDRSGTRWVEEDEHPRPDTTLEKLKSLRPAFREGGTVTAGNASGINDGAAALLLATPEKARAYGLKPLGRIVSTAVAGVDPSVMGIGPVPAVRKALKRAGLTIDQVDLVELNEAFAAQSLACMRELGIPEEKCNVNGGSIAIGHPLGSTGARLLTSLLYEMKRRQARFGLVTMCIGVGQGIATVVERIEG
ncbi:acetyl-CoA C-acetyltransferase/3-oxo-5,6-didehydrosuberyl-CoA/3-oxoadipyl-CoA thiolase [Planifilum fimeticola]|uniref:acetyl-CoA C-acyltransferase n=1 Tax=Planifilum fimeticola TaxID=201975 RepID=A0A2T0LGF9_9BACL|nr:thiolase family protein [Planifilum fimeticola]PRX41324.1 acetyl-CoA C-acetyltransferase/3-oxo-5,6-didehydrosuberyl-CoA/3-oxoadipyl-CoA thiolase [Planifilum fimeticola]